MSNPFYVSDDYDNRVWSSAEYRNHVSPHMIEIKLAELDEPFFSKFARALEQFEMGE